MANVNVIQKTISGTPTDFYYEDTYGRDLIGAEQDQSLTAIKAYVVDDLFWYKDELYVVTASISSGGNIVLGTGAGVNATKTTVSDELKRRALSSDITTALSNKQDKSITARTIEGQTANTVEGAIDTLNSTKAGLSDLAPAFSTATQYYKNDCVIYEGDVYRFKQNHQGDWVASHADHITVTEAGGHQMITATEDDTDVNAVANLGWSDASDEKVINAYTAKKYSNTDSMLLYVQVPANQDTVGTWNDSSVWKTDGVRTGWMFHKYLYNILSDYSVEIMPVFDCGYDEVVSLYAFRVDDEVYGEVTPVGTENPYEEGWYIYDGNAYVLTTDTSVQLGTTYYILGGAVAFKFNGKIQTNNLKVGMKLIRQRTETFECQTL